MTDAEFETLKNLCRAERARALAGHWSYELARHTALFNKYKTEKARRDAAAIDAAFDRANRILEAAE